MAISQETITKLENAFNGVKDDQLHSALIFTLAEILEEKEIIPQDDFFDKLIKNLNQ